MNKLDFYAKIGMDASNLEHIESRIRVSHLSLKPSFPLITNFKKHQELMFRMSFKRCAMVKFSLDP